MTNLDNLVVLRSSWVQRIDPVTKLLLIVCVLLGSFLYRSLMYSLTVLGITLGLVLVAHIGRKTWRVAEFSLFLIATMVFIQGFFYQDNQTVLVTVFQHPFYREGLLYACVLGSRLLAIIFVTSFFIFTTTITENTHYLEQVGVPYQVVYVLMSVCYVLPQMMQNMHRIQLAQRARGINPQSTIMQRVRAIIPVLIPLVIKTLMQSVERSTALQLRGFNNPHRQLPEKLTYQYSRIMHWGLLGTIIILGGWKIWMIGNKLG